METIHFLITGGTIDSFYEGTKDTVETLNESVLPGFIKSLKLHFQTEFTTICMKDSRAIDQQDLAELVKAIKGSSHKRIIITHGTYTMPDTARYLEANLADNDKTIILTGSMIPLMGFSPSDAPFNIGFAAAKALELPPCIRVCMNGQVFEPNEVLKVIKDGKFDSIFNR